MVTRLRRERPEPSYTSVAGRRRCPVPPRVSSDRRPRPASKEPVPEVARPTWWPTTSAPSLSLTSRIRSAISDSGALSTEASSSVAGGTTTRCGAPDHLQAGGGEGGGEGLGGGQGRVVGAGLPSGAIPLSTMSAVIGLTMSSGT